MQAIGQEKLNVGFRITVEQYDKALDIAEGRDTTLSAILREAVELYLRSKAKKAA